jgi:hypothetical protein
MAVPVAARALRMRGGSFAAGFKVPRLENKDFSQSAPARPSFAAGIVIIESSDSVLFGPGKHDGANDDGAADTVIHAGSLRASLM